VSGRMPRESCCGWESGYNPGTVPFDYIIDRERRLVISVAYGRLTFEEVEQHQHDLLADPEFERTFDQIGDFTRVTDFALTPEQVRIAASRCVFSAGSRRVGIAPDDLPYAMMRMFETYREMFGGGEITQVVRTREEAMAWYESHPKKKASA
jgi:hypothetical protein